MIPTSNDRLRQLLHTTLIKKVINDIRWATLKESITKDSETDFLTANYS